MKLAIPLNENNKNSVIAIRFARAKYLAIVDKEQNLVDILPNPCQGISTQAGKCIIHYLITRQEIDTIVAYEIGLKVQQIAQKNNIQLILINEKNKSLNQLLSMMKIKNKM